MAYIGRQLVRGQNRVLDDISSSFNGSTTAFNLTVSSSSSPPASVNQLWIILGGILQKPGTDFTVADAVITFTTAPASTLSFWGMIQGDTSDINSPADASVTPSKIANSGDFAFPADVRFNDADGSHYVGLQAPSTVSSNLVWTLPAADGSANQLLKTDGSGALGWATDGNTTLTGSTNNTITTVTGANAIQGEANLTYDGTTLLSNADTAGLTLRDSSAYAANTGCQISFQGKDSNEATKAFGAIKGLSVSADNGQLRFQTRTGGTLYDRLTILADGKCGIGTTDPGSLLELNAANDTAQLKFLRTGTTIGGVIHTRDESGSKGLTYTAQDGNSAVPQHCFQTNDGSSISERFRITQDGTIHVNSADSASGGRLYAGSSAMYIQSGNGRQTFKVSDGASGVNRTWEITTDGNLKAPNGKGIDFSAQTTSSATGATPATSAGDEVLDHYERGVWSPTSTNVTYVVSNADYIRIGNLVHISLYMTFPSTSDGNTNNIGGLPFNLDGGNNYCYLVGRVQGQTSDVVVQLNTADNTGNIYVGDSALTNTQLSGRYVLVSGTYMTA